MRLSAALLAILIITNILPRMEFYAINKNKILKKRQLSGNYYPDLVQYGSDGGDGGGGSNSDGKNECSTTRSCSSGGMFGKGNPKQKASNIALKAAQEAKAANDAQVGAAEAAAQQVKLELAEKAIQSARAAEAALAGKQQICEQLDQERREAEAVVNEVSASLQNTQSNANAASQAAVEAQNQLTHLKSLVKAADNNLANIENVANGAQQELAEKTQLLEAARNRVDGLNKQISVAKQDFERTKQAAYKAACAAVEAKQKATRTRRMSAVEMQAAQQQQSNSNAPPWRNHRRRNVLGRPGSRNLNMQAWHRPQDQFRDLAHEVGVGF